ncbi:MAG: zinc ribbon domain-containing protein [Acidobacteriota bacterium]
MPIYKYTCEKCGSHVEVIQRISDAPPKRCEKCGGKVKKAVSRTSFQLKGSGWYASDYSRKDSPASKDQMEKGADKKSESVPDKTSESVSKTTASGDKD